MRQLYDLAVYPAALDTLPEELTRGWPAKYDDELLRAKTSGRPNTTGEGGSRGRGIQQTGRDVHAGYLNDWVKKVRSFVDTKIQLKWARSFFFGVEMRGMKNREDSLHPPPEGPLVNAGEMSTKWPLTYVI
ncbi:hypothetical protein CTheo_9232 [Ceratobasidium theobromae]|uniref:Uncharacterized protein n=1 Tax=Ceratobasidium theobromae TaxID=1582974 RepID=A0A5N5Q640_9AGAM|nr:hypothetical protein CTheo_9232 [Ceratobasidium theobromae]